MPAVSITAIVIAGAVAIVVEAGTCVCANSNLAVVADAMQQQCTFWYWLFAAGWRCKHGWGCYQLLLLLLWFTAPIAVLEIVWPQVCYSYCEGSG